MGNSKTFNYPKSNSKKTSAQAGHESRVEKARDNWNQAQNFQSGNK